MLQLKILQLDTRLLYVPTGIDRLSIDVKKHITYVKSFGEEVAKLPVYLYKESGVIRCGGIEISGLKASSIARKKNLDEPVLEKYEFVPNEATDLSLEQSVRVNLQIVLENMPTIKVKVVELLDGSDEVQVIAPIVHKVLSDMPLIQPEITVLSKNHLDLPNVTVVNKNLASETDCHLVIGTNLLNRNIVS